MLAQKMKGSGRFPAKVPYRLIAALLFPLGLYMALDLNRMLTLFTSLDTLVVETDNTELHALQRDGSSRLVSSADDPDIATSDLEIVTSLVPRGSLVLRQRIHRNQIALARALLDSQKIEAHYERYEARTSFFPLGTIWQLRVDGRIDVDPVYVLSSRHRASLPTGLSGLTLLFLVIPALLALDRARRHKNG